MVDNVKLPQKKAKYDTYIVVNEEYGGMLVLTPVRSATVSRSP